MTPEQRRGKSGTLAPPDIVAPAYADLMASSAEKTDPRAGPESADREMRVLLLDSNAADHETMTALIRDALDARCVINISSVEFGIKLATSDIHDLYVISLGRSIDDALNLIRATSVCRGPIIALAEPCGDDLELLALGAGAAECLEKPKLSRVILGRAIRRALACQHNRGRGTQHRVFLDREKTRLNGLQAVSHRVARGVCHDIRSPLTVIKTYSSILLSELAPSIDPEQTRFLRTIIQRVDDLGNMVDNILDASQVASDLVGSRREAILLGDLVGKLRPALERATVASEAQLNICMDAALTHVFCDRENIGRVIQNLVARACKAAGPGGKIELSARFEPEDMSVRIGVTDNRSKPVGDVIAPSRVPVYRQHRLPSVRSPGLALHIISELVRINLGKFSIALRPDGGSTSEFTIPAVDLDRILSSHLGVLKSGRQTVSSLSLVVATILSHCVDRHSKDIVRFLWSELRVDDLVVPVQRGQWALCIACDESEVVNVVRRLARSLEQCNRGHPDGALPSLALRIVGTWPLSTPSEEITAAACRPLSVGSDLLSVSGCESAMRQNSLEQSPRDPIHLVGGRVS